MTSPDVDPRDLESMEAFADRLSGRFVEPSASAQPAEAPRPASPSSSAAPPELLTGLDQMQQYHAVVEKLPGWRRIGDILVELGYATPEQVVEGLKAQRRLIVRQKKTVGLLEALQDTGVLTAAQAQHALNHQIAQCYLPALATAITEREKALAELRSTYQQSLQMIARYAEDAQVTNREMADLRKQLQELKTTLARKQR